MHAFCSLDDLSSSLFLEWALEKPQHPTLKVGEIVKSSSLVFLLSWEKKYIIFFKTKSEKKVKFSKFKGNDQAYLLPNY